MNRLITRLTSTWLLGFVFCCVTATNSIAQADRPVVLLPPVKGETQDPADQRLKRDLTALIVRTLGADILVQPITEEELEFWGPIRATRAVDKLEGKYLVQVILQVLAENRVKLRLELINRPKREILDFREDIHDKDPFVYVWVQKVASVFRETITGKSDPHPKAVFVYCFGAPDTLRQYQWLMPRYLTQIVGPQGLGEKYEVSTFPRVEIEAKCSQRKAPPRDLIAYDYLIWGVIEPAQGRKGFDIPLGFRSTVDGLAVRDLGSVEAPDFDDQAFVKDLAEHIKKKWPTIVQPGPGRTK